MLLATENTNGTENTSHCFRNLKMTLARNYYRDFAMQHEFVFATLSAVGAWTMYFCMLSGLLAITVNRFTALVWPVRYKSVRIQNADFCKRFRFEMWTKKVCAITIALCWIVPLPTGIGFLHPLCAQYRLNDSSFAEEFVTQECYDM